MNSKSSTMAIFVSAHKNLLHTRLSFVFIAIFSALTGSVYSSLAVAGPHPVCDALRIISKIDTQPQLRDMEYCFGLSGENCIYQPDRLQALCQAHQGQDCSYASNVGNTLCRIFKGENCNYVNSVPHALCMISGGKDCSYSESLAQGLCRSFQGENCQYVKNMGQAQCLALKGQNCLNISAEQSAMLHWQIKFDEYCYGVATTTPSPTPSKASDTMSATNSMGQNTQTVSQ